MKLVICSRRQRVQCFNRSQWIVWYSKSIVNRVYFEKFLFSSCAVFVQFASILIDMLRSKCPHLKTNWPLLRLHVEMNCFLKIFSSNFSMIHSRSTLHSDILHQMQPHGADNTNIYPFETENNTIHWYLHTQKP